MCKRKEKEKPFQLFATFEEFFAQAEERPGYWVERANLEFTNKVAARMKQLGINKDTLAKRLGVQPRMVTRLLNGEHNFGLAIMVRLAKVLDCELHLQLQPKEAPAGRSENQGHNLGVG